jgi:hypothetical protein
VYDVYTDGFYTFLYFFYTGGVIYKKIHRCIHNTDGITPLLTGSCNPVSVILVSIEPISFQLIYFLHVNVHEQDLAHE